MNNYGKNKPRQKPVSSIATLHNKLFDKLEEMGHKQEFKGWGDPYFEFEEDVNPRGNELLEKAKDITYNNRGKLEKIKREIKQCAHEQDQAFVTGVGLFIPDTQPPKEDWKQMVDEDELFKNIHQSSEDDLADLRRMIKKTQINLKSYSRSVYNIKNEIMNAADKYGNSIDVGLAIKINKCGFDNSGYKGPKYKMQGSKPIETIKKRAMSSHMGKNKP